MKYLIFALVLVLGDAKINYPAKVFYDLNEANDLFDKFIVQFNKEYDEDEYQNRLAIFTENLERINGFNKESNLTVYGISHLTDLTYEEVVNSYMGWKKDINSFGDVRVYKSSGSAPDRINYVESGYVTAVKNQGPCNSCYIFSAIGSIEGQHAKLHGSLISLSEQQGLDCDENSSCAHGGYMVDTMQVLAQQGGSMSSEDYPYENSKGQCRTDSSKIVVKVTGGYQLSVSDEEDLKSALAEHGPLSIGLHVCQKFLDYQGGLYVTDCPRKHGHAVLLVGYDQTADGTPFWIIKNSWDTTWGDQGYMNMKMGNGICGIGTVVAVATVE